MTKPQPRPTRAAHPLAPALVRSLLTFLVGLAVAWGCHGSDDAEVLQCEGECTCDDEHSTCTCLGGTDCAVEGGAGITLACEGNARCDLECGEDCHIECPGTAGCDVVIGDGSTAVCNGTGDCAFVCDGSCSVECPGVSRCTLDCPDDGACEITSCPMANDCGDGNLACRTDCPPV